jgi:cell pole-organizing protein PopZ
MAEQAQKEPTMEEILASIRKIISEDDEAPAAARSQPEAPSLRPEDVESRTEPDAQPEEELTLDDLSDAATGSDGDIFDEVELSMEDAVSPRSPFGRHEPVEEVVADHDALQDFAPTPERGLDDFSEGPADIDVPDFSPSAEAEPVTPVSSMAAPPVASAATIREPEAPATPAQEDTAMESAAKSSLDRNALTEDATADAAASALSRLASRMEMGSDNTLEALVRELIKPMIKAWLDDNLARIVEEKVEAEVQRISRLAR